MVKACIDLAVPARPIQSRVAAGNRPLPTGQVVAKEAASCGRVVAINARLRAVSFSSAVPTCRGRRLPMVICGRQQATACVAGFCPRGAALQ